MRRFARPSLFNKILLSTSLAITVLLAVTGWWVQSSVTNSATSGLEEEVHVSLRAYEALWRSRSEMLAAVSQVLSGMSDVRAAFSTGDRATIQDTAGEIWSRISRQDALFLVTDPQGLVVASLSGLPGFRLPESLPVVPAARERFPRQTTGFMMQDGRLYQVVVTPVYVQAVRGPALLNVLVAGFEVDPVLAKQLKDSTGSEFQFLANGRQLASTIDVDQQPLQESRQVDFGRLGMIKAPAGVFGVVETDLLDVRGNRVGQLRILRSFAGLQQRLALLRQELFVLWLGAVLVGLALAYLLASRLVRPLRRLEHAAAAVASQNYEQLVPVESEDELGRLAASFNTMCHSLQQAREELVRQEQISTIGRLATSIVHDLRNPLATIYGGAEILVDVDLPQAQIKRLASNIYRASRRMQEMLQDLVAIARGKTHQVEACRLREVAMAASEALVSQAVTQNVAIRIEIPESFELTMDRLRMERVFHNLFQNALEAMPEGGEIQVTATREKDSLIVQVEDNGPGIPEAIRLRLFQPFASEGKKNGLGLGLALARQTLLDHGGDLWAASQPGKGARFCLRLALSNS